MQLTNKKYKQHQYFATYIEESGKPQKLKSNANKSFQGSIILGTGFLLTPEEAQVLIDKDPRNKEVLFPYLNGDDLNNSPTQSPSRWVINFFDWPEEKARTYPDCFKIVEERVKPERMAQKDKGAKEKWWQYLRPRKELYNTISGLEQVMAIPNQACKYVAFQFVNSQMIFSNALAIIAKSDYYLFSILNSNMHIEWAWKYASRMKSDMRYTPTDVFETFPLPPTPTLTYIEVLEKLGRDFEDIRKKLMQIQNVGLTKLYNLFHKKHLYHDISDKDVLKFIESMRTLQQEIDYEVLKLYGWSDIDLNHSFYQLDYLPENDNIRFSISSEARKEILKRLLILNKSMYSEEQNKALSSLNKKAPKKTIDSNVHDLFSNF